MLQHAMDHSDAGHLLKRAIELRMALKLGVEIGLDEIPADEFKVMTLIETEAERFEREKQ